MACRGACTKRYSGSIRLKILHIITSLGHGGAQTALATLLPRLGLDGVVVSLVSGGAMAAQLRSSGIRIYELGMTRGRPSISAVLRLRKIIRNENPDLIPTWLYHADLMGLLADGGSRLVWNLRCSDMRLSRSTQLVRWLLAKASHLPRAVIVNSRAGQEYHRHLGYRPRRWEFIPNGIDTERFRPDAEARAVVLASRLALDGHPPIVGMVARVDPMKDHANFLAAAERVHRLRPDVHFVVVGADTENLTYPRSLRGNLTRLPVWSDMPSLMAALDLLVVSSTYGEGFPNVIGEAMACGVPCVSTDVGDAATIIGDTGVIVPRSDPEALSQGILRALDLDTGAAARQRIVENYGIGQAVVRYRELYESLVTPASVAPR